LFLISACGEDLFAEFYLFYYFTGDWWSWIAMQMSDHVNAIVNTKAKSAGRMNLFIPRVAKTKDRQSQKTGRLQETKS